MNVIIKTTLLALLSGATITANAQATKWPTQDGNYTIKNFRFGTGESLPELKLHYLTLGTPHRNAAGKIDNAVLMLHGTGGTAHSLISPEFTTVLYGPGQPLDITKFFLIFPDSIGHGQSSKPSDGLHMRFPHYDYDDMVAAQHTMLLESLHVDHLRLILGTSMGCMETFTWGVTYPKFADALVPLACLPVELAGRNRMIRYATMQLIREDPAWNYGEYTTQPPAVRHTCNINSVQTAVPLQAQKNFPTRKQADAQVDKMLAAPNHTDANDLLYWTDASRNYNPEPKLSTITAHVLWINSADDHTNPAELRIAEKTVTRMPHALFVLLPISDETRGHGTSSVVHLWKDYLIQLMKETPPQ